MNRRTATLPLWSCARQVTRVRPSRKKLPERGLHVAPTWPSRLSTARTWKATLRPFALAVVTLRTVGAKMVGGRPSPESESGHGRYDVVIRVSG